MLKPSRHPSALRLSYFALAIGLFISGCSRSDTSQARIRTESAKASEVNLPGPESGASGRAILQNVSLRKTKNDACDLLRSKDIQSIQGEALKDTKASDRAEGGLHISQCFYSLATFSKSIALTLTVKDGGRYARDPREFWNETFHRDKDSERRRAGEDAEEKEAIAESISGVGEEAFWTGSRVGGALYVLKGKSLFV
ncbi:MAG TPA: hypothetical protein VE135_08860 [Pyrinomonadaceae bacterium]|nr:hypothetical protein [Pyrinomonadaceae bacterium]